MIVELPDSSIVEDRNHHFHRTCKESGEVKEKGSIGRLETREKRATNCGAVPKHLDRSLKEFNMSVSNFSELEVFGCNRFELTDGQAHLGCTLLVMLSVTRHLWGGGLLSGELK